MATVDAWGGSWAATWLLHWTYEEVASVPGGGGAGGGQARSRAGGFWRGGRFYPAPQDEPNPFRPEPIKEPVREIEPEPVARARVEGPASLADIGRQTFKLKAPPAPIADPEAKPPPRIVKAKAPRTKPPGVDVLDAKPEASLEDRIEGAIERGMAKALSQLQAKPEKEPEDEEERELRLLRQLGFLH